MMFGNFLSEVISRPVVDILNSCITSPKLHAPDCGFKCLVRQFWGWSGYVAMQPCGLLPSTTGTYRLHL